MMKREDLTGRRFGMLTVIKEDHTGANWQHYWECVCDCGNLAVVDGKKLKGSKTKSCGCYKKIFSKTHGQSGKQRTTEYIAWGNMVQRCTNPSNNNYKFYGAKGIKVCQRWLSSFECFLKDMGLRPSKNHSIGRVENSGNYEPGNCRWETRQEQDRNKSQNNRIEYEGRSQIIKDWAIELGICAPTINYHLLQGRNFEWVYNRFKNNK